MNAYTGTILRVDLSRSTTWTEPLNPKWARKFIGASGLAARYLYDMVDANTDPLGPENPLIWMTGLLTGSRTPSSSRSAFCGRSPLTGIWGESNVGGFIGTALRDAGYDGVIITGRSDKPVYLHIDGDHAELLDARPFWGLDTFQAQEQIRQAGGDRRLHVACIGPAGENLVRYATIMTGDGRAAGRTGMGALMGSKRLKAIALCGKSGSRPLAERDRFNQAAQSALAHVREDFFIDLLKVMGSSNGTEYLNMLGAVPARYWTRGEFDGIENLNGAVLLETLRVGSGGCWGCYVQCGPEIEIPDGPFKMPVAPGPEYETLISLGSQLLIGNLKAVSYFGHQCDALGMDTISAGAAIGFGQYLFDRGVIGPKETGGLNLEWGNETLVAHLLPMMAQREGLGDIMAEGTRTMERRFDAPGLAVQINGLDPGMHDPRGISGMAAVYLTSPRGACHNKSDFYMIAAGHSFPELDIETTDTRANAGIGGDVARHQTWRSFVDSSGCCQFVNAPIADLVEMVNAAAGWEETVASLTRAGERILTLKRLVNLKLGFTRADEVLPKLWTLPLAEGNTEGFVPDANAMLAEYYHERDWDIRTGRPSQAKLTTLELSDLT